MRYLQKLGYSADLAVNGAAVLEVMKRKTYDLILMDCQMPEMDGYEATLQIRRDETERYNSHGTTKNGSNAQPALSRVKPVRIIAMTSNTMESDRERCMAVGMDDYVVKPVNVQELKRVLQESARLSPNIFVDSQF
jgi:CheY-like chemotaxis protein